MSSHPLRRRVLVNSSRGNVASIPAAGASRVAAFDVDGELERRIGLHGVEERPVRRGVDLDRNQAGLRAVVAEDVREARRHHRLEPVVLEGPDRVLPRRADAEVGSGDEDGGSGVDLVVEHEVAVVPPFREETRPEPGALDPLQPVRRDDLVGVDVRAVEGDRAPADDPYRAHRVELRRARRSVRRPRSRRRPPVRRGGCGRRGPGALRSSGWRWMRRARPARACRGSSRGTSSSRVHASRSRPR